MKFFKKKKSDRNLSTSVQGQKPTNLLDSPMASSIKKKPLPNDSNVTKISIPQATKLDEIPNTRSSPLLVMPKPRRLLTPTRAILGRFDHDKTQVEDEDETQTDIKNSNAIMAQDTLIQQEISPILLPTAREVDSILPQLTKKTTRLPHATVSSLSTILSDDSSSRVYMSACESVANSADENHSDNLPDIVLQEIQPSTQIDSVNQQQQQQTQDGHSKMTSHDSNVATSKDSDVNSDASSPYKHQPKLPPVARAGQSSTSSATSTPVLQKQQQKVQKLDKPIAIEPKRAQYNEPLTTIAYPSETQNQILIDEHLAEQKRQRMEQQRLQEQESQRQLMEQQRLQEQESQRQLMEQQRLKEQELQRQLKEQQRLQGQELQRKFKEQQRLQEQEMQRQIIEHQRLQNEQEKQLEKQKLLKEQEKQRQQLEKQRLREKDQEQEQILKELKDQIELMEQQRIRDREEWNRKEQELLSHRQQMMEALLETKDQISIVLKKREESKMAYQQQMKQQQLHQLQQKVAEMAISIEQLPDQMDGNKLDEELLNEPNSENATVYGRAQQHYGGQYEYGYDDDALHSEEQFEDSPRRRVNKSRSEEHLRHNTRSSSRSSQRYAYQEEGMATNQAYMGYSDGYFKRSSSRNNNIDENRKSTVSRRSSNTSNKSSNRRPSPSTPNPHQYPRRPRATSMETAKWYEEQQQMITDDAPFIDDSFVYQRSYNKPRRSRSVGREPRRTSSRNSMPYNGYDELENGPYDNSYEDMYYNNYVDDIPPYKYPRARYNSGRHFHPQQQYSPAYAPPNGYYFHSRQSNMIPPQQQHYRQDMMYEQPRHHYSFS